MMYLALQVELKLHTKRRTWTTHTSGICHTFTPDGDAYHFLKVLLTNICIYDCAYCINRVSNDIPRAVFLQEN